MKSRNVLENLKKRKNKSCLCFSKPGGGGTKEIVKARFDCKSKKSARRHRFYA